MEIETEDKFAFTWVIENFSLCHHSKGELLFSPVFTLNALPRMKWFIAIYPKGFRNEDYISVFVARADDVSEACSMECFIQGLDCNERLIFSCNVSLSKFHKNGSWGRSCFFKRKLLFRSLIKDILIIKCSLKPVLEANALEIMSQISYKNGLFTDVVLHTHDAVFNVHKAILWARWPKLIKELNKKTTQEINFDIPSNVLESMIKYVYTGKTDFLGYELFEKLSTAAVTYGLPNLSSIPTISKKCRTRINVVQISFEWPVENFSNMSINTILYNAFIVEMPKPCRWCLQLYIRENDKKDRIFEISIIKPNYFESKPIFVKSKISFDVTNCFENDHLFEKDKKWKCAEFLPNISKDPQDALLLKCEFKFSDCNHSSETLEISCGFAPSIKCHYFSNSLLKLYRSGQYSDVNLLVASKTLSAHKFILCARSSVFYGMFKKENANSANSGIEIADVDPDVMDEMLEYMYSGRLEKPLNERAIHLYAAGDKYNVSAFKEECSAFLKSNLSAKNVCKVVQLAHSHSDDDLYKSTLKYFSEHAKDIFSTQEWKTIAKENLYARGLENLIASKITEKSSM
ncbi:Speckle-type POZ protein B, partial [Stegodyphus mimosarum]